MTDGSGIGVVVDSATAAAAGSSTNEMPRRLKHHPADDGRGGFRHAG